MLVLRPVGEDARAGGGVIKTEQGAKDTVAQMIGEFGSVFIEEGQLKPMKGEPMTIHMQKDVVIKPLHICTPRKTPYAYQTAAKAKLDEDEANGVIEKVEGPSPSRKVRSVLELVTSTDMLRGQTILSLHQRTLWPGYPIRPCVLRYSMLKTDIGRYH